MASPGPGRQGQGQGGCDRDGGSVPWPALVATLLAGLFVTIVWLVQRQGLPAVDREVADALLRWRSDPLDRLFWLFTLLGNDVFLGTLAASLVLILALRGLWDRAVLTAAAMALGQGVSSLLKNGIGRERPPEEYMLIEPPSSGGMPSGHALMTLVVVVLLLFVTGFGGSGAPPGRGRPGGARAKRLATVGAAAAVVALIGLSRIYLGVHWTTDVLGGWSVGGAWVALCLAVFSFLGRGGRLLPRRPALGGAVVRRFIYAVLGVAVAAAYVIAGLTDPLS